MELKTDTEALMETIQQGLEVDGVFPHDEHYAEQQNLKGSCPANPSPLSQPTEHHGRKQRKSPNTEQAGENSWMTYASQRGKGFESNESL